MAARVDFSIADNADEAFPITLETSLGAGIDYSGSSWRMDVKVNADDAEAALSLSDDDGSIDASEAGSGAITVTFPAGGLQPGTYVQDLLRIEGEAAERIWSGTVKVTRGVTVLA